MGGLRATTIDVRVELQGCKVIGGRISILSIPSNNPPDPAPDYSHTTSNLRVLSPGSPGTVATSVQIHMYLDEQRGLAVYVQDSR